ncbi:MAG: hypothetical protein JWQ24_4638 [Tardiphaga sp.]|nr:hypothetical protein [Tardiphaga sp.]
MTALCNRMARNPKLDVPRDLAWPRKVPQADADVMPRPRCLIDAHAQTANAAAVVEIWCLDDLMSAAISHGASDNKAKAMKLITDYGATPDGVVAFGTAGYPGDISYDGCATIGGTIFIRDAANDGGPIHSNWTWPGHVGVLVPSSTPASFFSNVLADPQTVTKINSQMLEVPVNPASKPRLVISSDAVAISSVNIPKDTEFAPVDLKAIAAAQAAGATNIASVETTHGVIRAQWPDAPFIYVTAIPNRVGHFQDEARNNYPQEFGSTHNAGIALNHIMPHFVEAIA